MLSVELHAHSALSHDGRDSVEFLLERASAVGLDAIAITDHDEIDASLDAASLAPEYGLIGVPGVEITSTAGHVLGLGIDERVPAGLRFGETLDRIHEGGGIAVVPHPFQSSRHGVGTKISREKLARADAIEIYNSRLLTGRANRKAERFARSLGLPMTAGSDAHIGEMVGQAVTRVDTGGERSADAVLRGIHEGQTAVDGKRTPWRISFRQAGGGAKRRMRNHLTSLFG